MKMSDIKRFDGKEVLIFVQGITGFMTGRLGISDVFNTINLKDYNPELNLGDIKASILTIDVEKVIMISELSIPNIN